MARLWLPRSGKYGAQQPLDVLGSKAHKLSLSNTHSSYTLSASHFLKASSVTPQKLAFPLT